MARSGDDLRRAVDELAIGPFVMTAAHETKRAGMMVSSVQRCADTPLLLCVAARKGHAIEPLIRDSRRFGLCRVSPEDRATIRRFEHRRVPEDRDDPFDSFEVTHLVSRVPILRRSLLVFDCEVCRHFDLEADHELYIGLVVGARSGPA